LATHPAQAQTFTVLYSFKASPDGNLPASGVIRDAAGNLYGTTYYGGAYGYGTVFKINKYGKEKVLYSFTGGADGANPGGGLVRDAAGNLYGTTDGGGNPYCGFGNYCGTVYKVDKYGNETVLYRFGGLPDGHSADSSLILDDAGNLYGTTQAGGDNGCNPGYGCGTVFKINTHSREIILHTFTGTRDVDGAFPYAALVADANGNLYGTTKLGGAPTCITDPIPGFLPEAQPQYNTGGCGTVFKINRRGKERILHRFSNYAGGVSPLYPLIFDNAGNMYSTAGGGNLANGIVFMLDPQGREKVLYNFSYDEGYPAAGLVQDANGNLYGVTNQGGHYYEGTVFKLDKFGKYTILHDFSGYSDGGFPRGTLVMDEHGNLYGTAPDGGNRDCGQYGCGVVYKIKP
jgi:uncharacterized repeat protein (TIGR03803 family)